MNFNNYTIKSQEALQQAQQIAQGLGHQQIENEHLFKAIGEVDENVLPFILKKLNINVDLIEQILDKELESFPKVSGGDSSGTCAADCRVCSWHCSNNNCPGLPCGNKPCARNSASVAAGWYSCSMWCNDWRAISLSEKASSAKGSRSDSVSTCSYNDRSKRCARKCLAGRR